MKKLPVFLLVLSLSCLAFAERPYQDQESNSLATSSHIYNLKKSTSNNKKISSSKTKQIQDWQKEIVSLKDNIKLKEQRNQELIQKTTQLISENQALQNANVQQRLQIADLQQQLTEKTQQEETLEKLQQSMVTSLTSESPAFSGANNNTFLGKYFAQSKFLERFMPLINFIPLIAFIMVLILLFLIVLSCWLINKLIHGSKKQQPTDVTSDKVSKKEASYNYLAGEDVVTSKLDLARAYFDMGDYDNAKEILKGVLKEGNEAQQKKAKQLLEEIAK